MGISATSMLTEKAKESEMDSNKNVITMAAQTYLQNNKSLVPKVIGETKNIRVIELRKANYLTKNILSNWRQLYICYIDIAKKTWVKIEADEKVVKIKSIS